MRKNWRFVYQDNQFWGECMPCTLAVFNNIINLAVVGWKISTRQEVEYAVAHGLPLDKWALNSDFQQFCLKRDVMPRAGETFRQLSIGEKLIQWTNALKMSLPCFIFAASEFDLVPVTDKWGNPVLDEKGQQVMRRRRQLKGIHLSGLFMFDADKLTVNPTTFISVLRWRDSPGRCDWPTTHRAVTVCGWYVSCGQNSATSPTTRSAWPATSD